MSVSDLSREERLAYIKARFDRGATVFKEHGDFLFAELARLEAERDAQEKVLAKANACAAMLLDVRQGKRSEDDWRIGEALDEWIWASEAALASPSAEGQSAGREA